MATGDKLGAVMQSDIGASGAGGVANHDATQAALDTKMPVIGKGVNLLDNWYFVGGGSQQGGGQFPINQRGQTSYSSAGYTIDRWEMLPYYIGTAELTASGLVLTGGSVANPGIMLEQKLETLPYDTYTLSCLSDGVLGSRTANINSDTDFIDIAVHSTLNVRLKKDLGRWLVWMWITQAGVSHTVQVIKLELGDTQTLAHQENGNWVLNDPPPNFQQELAKCQRYYEEIPIVYQAAQTNSDYMIPFKVTKAKNPSYIAISYGSNAKQKLSYYSGNWVDVDATVNHLDPPFKEAAHVTVSGVPTGMTIRGRIIVDAAL